MIDLRHAAHLFVDHSKPLQRRNIAICFLLVSGHQPGKVRIMHGDQDGLSAPGFYASNHRLQMSPGLVGREKLLLVERVVASREENNIVRIELLKCAIKTSVEFGGVFPRKSIVDDTHLSAQICGEDETQKQRTKIHAK